MTERLDDRALAAALAELGEALSFPPTPRLAPAVVAAIRAAPSRSRAPWSHGQWSLGRWSLGRGLGRSLVLGLAATLLLAGLAAAIGFALGGLRITFGGPSPGSPLPHRLVLERAFGDPVSVDQLDERLAFTPLAPTLVELGAPDHVYVAEPPAGGGLALIWGDRPRFAADPESGLSIVLTEFRADIGPETFEKMVNAGVRIEVVRVNGHPAYWIEGGEHFFFYRDANGEVVEGTLRLVESALVWEQDGLTLRIEGAPSRREAVRIAESLAPLGPLGPG